MHLHVISPISAVSPCQSHAVGVPTWMDFRGMSQLLPSSVSGLVSFSFWLEQLDGSWSWSIACQVEGYQTPLSAPVGLGLWVRARLVLTHAQVLAWLIPWPLLSPGWDHPVSTISGNGQCRHFHNKSTWVLFGWMFQFEWVFNRIIVIVMASVIVPMLEWS